MSLIGNLWYLMIPPNWGDIVKYSRKWNTKIQKGIARDEVRSAIYTWPRRTLQFDIFETDYKVSAYLKRNIFEGIKEVWGIPFWQDETYLTSNANSGQAVLNVESTAGRNFEVGAPCVVWTGYNTYEVGEISAFDATSITLTANLTNTWLSGAAVYPVLQGRIKNTLEIMSQLRDFSEATIEIEEAFDTSITRYIGDAGDFGSFLSLPVLDVEPDPGSLKQISNRPFKIEEYYGKQLLWDEYDETELGFRGSWDVLSRTDAWKLVKFFDAQQGRLGAFYLPSNARDFDIISPFSASSKVLNITDINWATYWEGTNAGRAIIIFWPDGTWKAAEIADSETGKLYLNTPIGKDSGSDLESIESCFLIKSRFNQDELKLSYTTPEVSETNLSFKDVKWTMPQISTTTTTTTTTTSTTTSTT